MITIGFDGRIIYPQASGVRRFAVGLLTSLLADEYRDQVHVKLYSGPRSDFASIPKASNLSQETAYSSFHFSVLRNGLLLPFSAYRHEFDLFHSVDVMGPFSLWKGPLITTVHDLIPLIFPELSSKRHLRMFKTFFGPMLRISTKIHTPSHATANDLMKHFSIPASKIEVIQEGIEPWFTPAHDDEKARVRKKYNLVGRFVLFVGNIEPKKNLPTLLKAFDQYCERVNTKDVSLVIGGKIAWLAEETLRISKSMKNGERVKFLGFVDDADLPGLYSSADVFVFPSIYEGYGLPPLEAIACGCPVIVSNVSSLPEVVGDAGILVEPRDYEQLSLAIERVVGSDDLRTEMRNKGLNRANELKWERVVKQYLSFYQAVYSK